jgi:hypothetical protein
MASSSTEQQQLQAHDSVSSQHFIQYAQQLPSKSVGEVLKDTAASNATCLIPAAPAPTKFLRKKTCLERAASIGKIKINDISIAVHRQSMYKAHRQYVHSLIMATEVREPFDESSSRDLWAACESVFEMN